MHRLRNPPTRWTRIPRLRPIHIQLVRNAILPRVGPLVDVAVIAHLPEQFLHPLLVALFSSADEVIVRNSHPLPKLAKLRRDFIRILLRSFPRRLRRPLNLLPVLVRPGEKERLRAEHALPPRNGVASDGRVSVPNMRPRI